MINNKNRIEKRATIVASFTATALIIIKAVIGFMSGSVAVLASAIDSILDLVISLFNYFALNKASKPADDEFNYGRGKIEAIAAVIEGTIITISGLVILYVSIKKAYLGEATNYLGISILVMFISIFLTLFLVFYLNKVAEKTDNLVIKSDALHYKTDLYSNGAILLALGLIYITGFEIIDSIMGILIAIYIIYSAINLIKEALFILLDGAIDKEIVEKIKRIIEEEEMIDSYHYLKTRRSGNTYFVDVHLVFNSKDILLIDAHHAGDRVEEKIMNIDRDKEWAINIHLDPIDDSIPNQYY